MSEPLAPYTTSRSEYYPERVTIDLVSNGGDHAATARDSATGERLFSRRRRDIRELFDEIGLTMARSVRLAESEYTEID